MTKTLPPRKPDAEIQVEMGTWPPLEEDAKSRGGPKEGHPEYPAEHLAISALEQVCSLYQQGF